MATTYKVLGQATCGGANSETTVYTVPAGTQAIVSLITICNGNSSANRSYRLAARGGGATLAAKHYLAYNQTVSHNNTDTYALGMTLGAGDIISFSDSVGSNDVSCQVFGAEIS